MNEQLLRQKFVTWFSFLLLIVLGLACGAPTRNPPVLIPLPPPPLSTPERQFPRQSTGVTAVAFNPDGRWLATGGEDRQVRVWDFSSAKLVRSLSGHSDGITSLAFSPDGRILASASKDRTARLWDFLTGQELRALTGHTGEVLSVAFSVDGKTLATASADKTVKFWNVTTGIELRTLTGHRDEVNAVAFNSDGILLASAGNDEGIRLWNTSTGQLVRTIDSERIRVLAFSPDARILAAGGAERMQVLFHLSRSQGLKLLDPQSGTAIHLVMRSYPSVTALAFRPDGGALAVGYVSEERTFDIDVVDVKIGKVLYHYRAHAGFITGLAYDADGLWLVSVGLDKEIRAWRESAQSDRAR